jgi:DNA-binding transcriptional ArsR family regulator
MATNKVMPQACCTLAIAGIDQDWLVAMFKALGNPIRFEIMKFLVTHPGSITSEIVEYLPIAQATTSQHLKMLRDAGWIDRVVEGPTVNYRLNEEIIEWFRSSAKNNHTLSARAESWSERFP